MKVDLPTPGTPEMPSRNDWPVCGSKAVSSSSACARWSARVDSSSVMALAMARRWAAAAASRSVTAEALITRRPSLRCASLRCAANSRTLCVTSTACPSARAWQPSSRSMVPIGVHRPCADAPPRSPKSTRLGIPGLHVDRVQEGLERAPVASIRGAAHDAGASSAATSAEIKFILTACDMRSSACGIRAVQRMHTNVRRRESSEASGSVEVRQVAQRRLLTLDVVRHALESGQGGSTSAHQSAWYLGTGRSTMALPMRLTVTSSVSKRNSLGEPHRLAAAIHENLGDGEVGHARLSS